MPISVAKGTKKQALVLQPLELTTLKVVSGSLLPQTHLTLSSFKKTLNVKGVQKDEVKTIWYTKTPK
jgi:hypothetical protein